MTNEELENIDPNPELAKEPNKFLNESFRARAIQGATDMGLTEDEAERAVDDWIDRWNEL